KAFTIIRGEEVSDRNTCLAAFDAHAGDSNIRLSCNLEARPEWIETMGGHLAGCGIFADLQGSARYGDFLASPCRVVIPAKRQIDQQHIEAEKSKDRPGPNGPEKNTNEHPAGDQGSHQDGEAHTPQPAIGPAQ